MPVNFTGSWINQNESTLEITDSGGVISGRFESGVGDDGQTLWVDVTGRALDDIVTFNAVYAQYGTIVSWVGQLTTDGTRDTIKTQWLHVTNIPDNQEREWMWYSNRIGADIFTRS
jgi:hypothetical protein